MTQFSNKFKKPCFWPIFPLFGAKKIFLENPALSRTKSLIQLKENAWTDGRKDGQKDGRKEGRKDGQTLFYRTLLATARHPIKKNTCRYHYQNLDNMIYMIYNS